MTEDGYPRGPSGFGPHHVGLHCNSDMVCTHVMFAGSIFAGSNFRGSNFQGRRTNAKYAKNRYPRKIPAIQCAHDVL